MGQEDTKKTEGWDEGGIEVLGSSILVGKRRIWIKLIELL